MAWLNSMTEMEVTCLKDLKDGKLPSRSDRALLKHERINQMKGHESDRGASRVSHLFMISVSYLDLRSSICAWFTRVSVAGLALGEFIAAITGKYSPCAM